MHNEHRLDATGQEAPLAIICGGGNLPPIVADAAIRRGRRVFLVAVRGWADPGKIERFPHRWVNLGKIGEIQRLLQAEGCRDLVFIGRVLRPAIRQVWPDLAGIRLWLRIIRLMRRGGGDDQLLSGIGRVLEEAGFHVLGAHEIAPEILAPAGAFGRERPSEQDLTDVARGLKVLAAVGPFDVGQAIVVARERVLALEAAEGTDHILARVAGLRSNGRVCLSGKVGGRVKARKPGQDRRFDLPTIGPLTVEGAARAGLAGIAVVAGETIVADAQAVAAVADRQGLFIIGVRAEGA